jgi:hypothetical protein
MILRIDITLNAILLNDTAFDRAHALEAFERVLGPPSRSDGSGPPQPYGHRNNVLHYYDHLGLLLREHHLSYLIEGIDILLEPSRWYFPTTSPFSGFLQVCGVRVLPEMEFSDFARQTNVRFQPHLGHAWFVDSEKLAIQLEVYFPARKRKADMGLISVIAVGFRRPE